MKPQPALSQEAEHNIRYREQQETQTANHKIRYQHSEQPSQEGHNSQALQEKLRATAFARILDLAPTLTESELRVLFEVTGQAVINPNLCTGASNRKLAERCKIGVSSVKRAIQALTTRGILLRRAGGSKTASRIKPAFMETAQMGGSTMDPPPALFKSDPGFNLDPPQANSGFTMNPVRPVPGSTVDPPPTQNQQLTEEQQPQQHALDIKTDSTLNIDRVIKAKPPKKHTPEFKACRGWMRKLVDTLGEKPDIHGPDDKIVQSTLAVAEYHRLENVFRDIWNTNTKVGYSWGWFPAVMMERIHGVKPENLEARRAELRLIRNRGKETAAAIAAARIAEQPAAPPAQPATPAQSIGPDPDFSRQLVDEATERLRMKDRARGRQDR